MRGLWHTEAERPQTPPMGHFHTKKVRGGKRSAAATCWWCSSSSCWLGANTHPIQFSITLHMPPVREAWTGALQSRAEQPQDAWEPLLAKQEEGCSCPEPGERWHCFLLREGRRFVWLSWAIQQGKQLSKSWNFSLVRRQSCSLWAYLGKEAFPLPSQLHLGRWVAHKAHSHHQLQITSPTWEKGLRLLTLNPQWSVRRLWSISLPYTMGVKDWEAQLAPP